MTCQPSSRCRRHRKNSPPQTGLRERHTTQPGTTPPHIRTGFASLPGSEWAAQSAAQARPIGSRLGHGSRHNRDRKTPPIGSGARHESAAHPPAIGNASAAQTARTAPTSTQPNPQLKKNHSGPPAPTPKPDYLPRLTRPQRTLYAVP